MYKREFLCRGCFFKLETCEGELGRVTVSLSFNWDDLGEVQKALQYILLKVQLDRLRDVSRSRLGRTRKHVLVRGRGPKFQYGLSTCLPVMRIKCGSFEFGFDGFCIMSSKKYFFCSNTINI